MVRFSNGLALAKAIVPTIQEMEIFVCILNVFLTKWQQFVQI